MAIEMSLVATGFVWMVHRYLSVQECVGLCMGLTLLILGYRAWRKGKRWTSQYVTTVRGDCLYLHHTPVWFFYRLKSVEFHVSRIRAFENIAHSLHSGAYPQVKRVASKSVWLPYEEEGWNIVMYTPNSGERFSLTILALCNLANWGEDSRISRYIERIWKSDYKQAEISREVFANTWDIRGETSDYLSDKSVIHRAGV